MKYERSPYEFPIDEIAQRPKADAPAGVYLLGGCWHLAAHDSLDELRLIDAGALLVATLTFGAPARATNIVTVDSAAALALYAPHSC